jgi:hypothetical protein
MLDGLNEWNKNCQNVRMRGRDEAFLSCFMTLAKLSREIKETTEACRDIRSPVALL